MRLIPTSGFISVVIMRQWWGQMAGIGPRLTSTFRDPTGRLVQLFIGGRISMVSKVDVGIFSCFTSDVKDFSPCRVNLRDVMRRVSAEGNAYLR